MKKGIQIGGVQAPRLPESARLSARDTVRSAMARTSDPCPLCGGAHDVNTGHVRPDLYGEIDALKGLVKTLWLYVGFYEEKQMATEQKELYYDITDPDGHRWWCHELCSECPPGRHEQAESMASPGVQFALRQPLMEVNDDPD